MRKAYDEIKMRKRIWIWGTGGLMNRYVNRIDPGLFLAGFCDSDSQKWEKKFSGRKLPCQDKALLGEEDSVIIAVESLEAIEAISKELDEKRIDYCHIYEAVKGYIDDMDNSAPVLEEPIIDLDKKLVKYIDCYIPIKECNLRCKYCYIDKKKGGEKERTFYHSPRFIRAALSRKRLGGTALINFCGGGETLLCKELLPVIRELSCEGHYISIVTNGTIDSAFDELLKSNVDLKHIFLKFSFHYLELKRLGILEKFSRNVIRMRNAGCSISVEITPSDELEAYIDEIKDFSMKNFGAFPHFTVARDESVSSFKLLTDHDFEAYKKIWGQFNSPMFDFKLKRVGLRQREYCMAGVWSLHLNLETGDLYKCPQNPWIDNIYENIARPIFFEEVGNKCCAPYCFNCHAYLTLGVIDGIESPTYYDTRDREMTNGEHWVTEEMKQIFQQRLYENNRECYLQMMD